MMSNSKLVSYTKWSPNNSGKRNHKIDRISPHCVVGQCSVETLGAIFANPSRQASCQYGIGKDGRVGQYVSEADRSWCTSSAENDNRAVTIECASDTTSPYKMNSKVYATLIKLCVDICKRNGKNKLIWFGNKSKSLNYAPKSNEMVITVHRWFANKACPGDWLYNRLGKLANEVTKKLGGSTPSPTPAPKPTPAPTGSYKVKITTKTLNIRKGPSIKYAIVGTVHKNEIYTIVETKSGWGKLKSGAGWIYLTGYTKKVK